MSDKNLQDRSPRTLEGCRAIATRQKSSLAHNVLLQPYQNLLTTVNYEDGEVSPVLPNLPRFNGMKELSLVTKNPLVEDGARALEGTLFARGENRNPPQQNDNRKPQFTLFFGLSFPDSATPSNVQL